MDSLKTMIAAGIASVFVLSCSDGGNPQELVGQWEYFSGTSRGKPMHIELFKNGTGTANNVEISWNVDGKHLAIISEKFVFSGDYEAQGDELAIVFYDWDRAIYSRRGKYKELEAKKAADAEAEKAKRAAEAAKLVAAAGCAGKSYKTVKIGSQVWMAENVNCNVSGSKCYGDDKTNCDKYGRLYDWETALAVCQGDWRLPANSDWDKLFSFADGITGTDRIYLYLSTTGGSKFKASSGWEAAGDSSFADGNGTDEFGFAAMPGGKGHSDGSFRHAGKKGFWWSSCEQSPNTAFDRLLDYYNKNAYWGSNLKTSFLSVRCMKDGEEGLRSSSLGGNGYSGGYGSINHGGQNYRTVRIGTQTWMAENLNYSSGVSKCFENKLANCKKYGRLYDWRTAKAACPKGWHLPTKNEWEKLTGFVGGDETEAEKLKSDSGWKRAGNGKDEFGFAALPGSIGYPGGREGRFGDVGYGGYWWTATEGEKGEAYFRGMHCLSGYASWNTHPKDFLFSARCIKD